MINLKILYQNLLKDHGPQGWWPINNKYHPGDYSYPKNDSQRFEICIGARLTQNTSWKNVERALDNLRKKKLLNAKKLKIFAEFFIKLKKRIPIRDELLSLWGIGKETADSILLYAYDQPIFVIDTYTRKFLLNQNIIKEKELNHMTYEDIKLFFQENLPKDYKLFQEYHALIVQYGKNLQNN